VQPLRLRRRQPPRLADWDTGTQQWVLRCAFDYAHCHKCEGETSIIEVELAPASS
jgi:hypothetical protein